MLVPGSRCQPCLEPGASLIHCFAQSTDGLLDSSRMDAYSLIFHSGGGTQLLAHLLWDTQASCLKASPSNRRVRYLLYTMQQTVQNGLKIPEDACYEAVIF